MIECPDIVKRLVDLMDGEHTARDLVLAAEIRPADHADMHKVSEDNSGSARMVTYEHQTSAGQTHQVTIRCEK